jgi:hypothetical protein
MTDGELRMTKEARMAKYEVPKTLARTALLTAALTGGGTAADEPMAARSAVAESDCAADTHRPRLFGNLLGRLRSWKSGASRQCACAACEVEPFGSSVNQSWDVMRRSADAAELVFYRNEFRRDLIQLTPAGERHLAKVIGRIHLTTDPVIVETTVPAGPPELDEGRRQLLVDRLRNTLGESAYERVRLGTSVAEGMAGPEAELFMRGMGVQSRHRGVVAPRVPPTVTQGIGGVRATPAPPIPEAAADSIGMRSQPAESRGSSAPKQSEAAPPAENSKPGN